ncbi:hypothetical protein HZB02_05515 [Candidatus Woesearchaeota archaeon]|nr:hypothetical protein [Candidatus Woesearchaeota archaeon]
MSEDLPLSKKGVPEGIFAKKEMVSHANRWQNLACCEFSDKALLIVNYLRGSGFFFWMTFATLDARLQTLHHHSVDAQNYHLRGSSLTIEGILYHYASITPECPYIPEGMLLDPSDTPYGLVLVAERKQTRKPVAILGFQAENTAITIVRLQGARKAYRELTPLDWERVLVEPVIAIAQETGFSHAAFYPAGRAADLDEKNEDTLHRRYNQTAVRCGFQWDDHAQLYIKCFHNRIPEA